MMKASSCKWSCVTSVFSINFHGQSHAHLLHAKAKRLFSHWANNLQNEIRITYIYTYIYVFDFILCLQYKSTIQFDTKLRGQTSTLSAFFMYTLGFWLSPIDKNGGQSGHKLCIKIENLISIMAKKQVKIFSFVYLKS